MNSDNINDSDIAVIAVSGRFPQSENIDEFWRNIREGRELITFFSDEELKDEGISPGLLAKPNYVKAASVLDDIEMFDAFFFDYSPREAEILDPQQRIFLECAWEAMESAGHDPKTYDGLIGVYAGMGVNTYLMNNLSRRVRRDSNEHLDFMYANDKDFLATRVAYKLDLTGPAFTVQTACSTSLVAIHLACQNLIGGECDMALAGGVSVRTPQKAGYLYEKGYPLSPDGHCRAFDADAGGTVFGNGAGVVVLKLLENAVEDGDQVLAVIKGSAINNDGSLKVGYTAPSVQGQVSAISDALNMAEVEAESIGYVETHGTGTEMGDPIEMAALSEAFAETTGKKGFCAVGSLKTNMGHLDTAAGVAGLIKTALALKHRLLPPSLNFKKPNPKIDFESSPFHVNTELKEWKRGTKPRRAGVSAFGIGGTNAHIILEEAPKTPSSGESRDWHLITLSAKTKAALDQTASNLAEHLKNNPDVNPADVAHTLNRGRQTFNHRRMLVCENTESAAEALSKSDPKTVFSAFRKPETRPVVFMFSGQGSQYINMGREIYWTEKTFAKELDRCAELLRPALGFDFRGVLYPSEENRDKAAEKFNTMSLMQPVTFSIEYALAKQWMEWGVHPEAMIGHSIGEYAAACLAGVFSLEDALDLVALRGKLMDGMPEGGNISIPIPEEEVKPFLTEGLSLATVNAPSMCVVSGKPEMIAELEKKLQKQSLDYTLLHIPIAAHSVMTEPLIGPFRHRLKRIKMNPPQIPFISCVSGDWIKPEEATDPQYWAMHLRKTVRFSDGVGRLAEKSERILLEVGAGRMLTSLAKLHPAFGPKGAALNSIPHPKDPQSSEAFLLTNLGKLWLAGALMDWDGFYKRERRHRLPLPTYPFQRQKYWITAPEGSVPQVSREKKSDPAEWFYLPSWKRADRPPLTTEHQNKTRRLIFEDEHGLGGRLAEELKRGGDEVVVVKKGAAFAASDQRSYTVNPTNPDDYRNLLDKINEFNRLPLKIIYLWNLSGEDHQLLSLENIDRRLEPGFYALLYLAQALESRPDQEAEISLITNHLREVSGAENIQPEKALAAGALKVVQTESSHITCRSMDFDFQPDNFAENHLSIKQLMKELRSEPVERTIAFRGRHRWVGAFEPVRLEKPTATPLVREGGVYLITGGLSGVGFALALRLALTAKVKLILTGRSSLPRAENHEEWLETHAEDDPASLKIKNIQALEKLGAEVMAESADAADLEQMERVVAKAKNEFGAVNGVIHSAGLLDGVLFPLLTPDIAEKILAPKVKGTLALDRLLEGFELDFLILCSSVSAAIAPPGQIGYCAANAFQDAFAQSASAAGKPVFAVGWDTWNETGFAFEAAQDPLSVTNKYQSRSREKMKVSHPLFDERVIEGDSQETHISRFDVGKHWVLDEHRILGKAVMPGTAYLEMALGAIKPLVGSDFVEIKDFNFLNPLIVEDDEVKEVRVGMKKSGDDYEVTVSSEDSVQRGGHARGTLSRLPRQAEIKHDLKAIEEKCGFDEIAGPRLSRFLGLEDTGDSPLQRKFGPRWNCLKKVRKGDDRCLAFLELGEELVSDLQSYNLHPGLLDIANAALMGVTEHRKGDFLPLSYKKITIREPLPAKIYSYVEFVEKPTPESEVFRFNITLMDESGKELVDVEEYAMRQVQPDSEVIRQFRAQLLGSSRGAGKSDIVSRIVGENLERGLLPAEGVDVFERILGASFPRVLVSTSDLDARIRDSAAFSLSDLEDEAEESGAVYDRPEIEAAYVAPDNETEKKLAEIWQKTLAIKQVGIHDNFFDLGGNSLLMGRLVAELTKAFGEPIQPVDIFEYPTVHSLAEYLTKGGDEAAEERESVQEKHLEERKGRRGLMDERRRSRR